MQTSNPKIPAFTVAEMLVVLVLSGILILLAMSVLNLVHKQISLVETNFDKNNQIINLERVLWQDFNQYKMYYDAENDFLSGAKPLDSVLYSFHKTYIVRNNDTLPVEIVEKTLFLEAKKISSGLVDAIELSLSENYQNTLLFCFQTKDATFYLSNKHQITNNK